MKGSFLTRFRLGSHSVPTDLVPGSPASPGRTWEPGTSHETGPGSGTKSREPSRVNVNGGSRDPNRGSWCTPKWLADLIGEFDLDPCSNERSHIRVGRTFSLEAGQDGLAESKRVAGNLRVFVNPPYERDSVLRWYRAYKHTRWCFLLRFDPSTDWFDLIYDAAELIAVPRGRRVNFEAPPGVKASSNAIAHALYYRHAADATSAVIRACATWRKKSRCPNS